MSTDESSVIRAKAQSPADRAWREALRRAGYQIAPPPIAVHPTQLCNPAGDKRAAEAAYAEFVAAEPENLMALDGLAFLVQHRGDWSGSLAIRRRRYAVEARQLGVPADRIDEVVAFLASSLGDGAAPAAAPTAYVASLFDEVAERYDEQLVNRLAYRGPALLRAAVDAVRGLESGKLGVLDLGCGTGLAGVAFRPLAEKLIGIDLSGEMLAQARQRNIYDALHAAEIVAYLGAADERCDLIVAADVLNYLGDLGPTLRGAARVLPIGGLLALTAESGEGSDFRLRGARRYQHSRDYLERTAEDAGFTTRSLEEVELRRELGEPVFAWCGVWERAGGAA